jgi:polyisoprenoid-binding protein YceI
LKVDGKVVATHKMDHTVPLTVPWDETFDIGSDTGTPVDDQDYQVPFAFTGTIDRLTFALDEPKLTAADEERLREAERKAKDH